MPSLRSLRRAERSLAFPESGGFDNSTYGISIYDWAKMFAPGAQLVFGGTAYQAYKTDQQPDAQLFGTNPIVYALAAKRILLFSEVRFAWQQYRKGRPGDLFSTPDLSLLENPWAGHTTRDLLSVAEMDVFRAGQSYWVRQGDQLIWLDPQKVKILTSVVRDESISGNPISESLEAYSFWPDNDPRKVSTFLPSEVCHYKPVPSPTNRFLGQSWLSPCLSDVRTDDVLAKHKHNVVANGAALNTVASLDPSISPEAAQKFIDIFRRQHEGVDNAGKTLFIGGGADVKTVGQTFENLMLQATQGAGEVRVAACCGIPPAIVGFSEGLRGSTLNAGNYGEARRSLADTLLRPLWGNFAEAMQSLVNTPGGARLWYDDGGVPFLREDLQDQATITETNTTAILKLVQGGWDPDAAVQAILTGDLDRLTGSHTGLYSVQLQPPGNGEMPGAPPSEGLPVPSSNGKQPALVTN